MQRHSGSNYWIPLSLSDHFYRLLPLPLQHVAFSIYGYRWRHMRMGGNYTSYVKEYSDRSNWLDYGWESWLRHKLQQLLTYAAEGVPFYMEAWSDAQKEEARIGNLRSLPLLQKSSVRRHPREFLHGNRAGEKHHVFHTSGSTGTPIVTYWNLEELRRSTAIREARSAGWAGVSYDAARATFSGRRIVTQRDDAPPYHRYNAAEGQVYFSAFHLRPDTAKYYCDALRRHKTIWLTGYAVSIYLLARFCIELQLDVPQLKAVITTSEKLTPRMREVIGSAFGCRVYEEYGTVENVIFASECEHGSLHVSPDIGIVEIVDGDGNPCDAGQPGEIIVTGLMRRSQPFIRYRIGDIGVWSDIPCSCGRAMPVLAEITGRMEDVVITPEGTHLAQFYGVFTDQPHVIESQIEQTTLRDIIIRLVTTDGFSVDDEHEIIGRMKERLGNSITYTVVRVPAIERNAAGKYKAVISHIDPSAAGG